MAIDLNDFELIEINASDTGEGIQAEYAYINKKHGPFGIAWKLVHQKVQTFTPKSGGGLQKKWMYSRLSFRMKKLN